MEGLDQSDRHGKVVWGGPRIRPGVRTRCEARRATSGTLPIELPERPRRELLRSLHLGTGFAGACVVVIDVPSGWAETVRVTLLPTRRSTRMIFESSIAVASVRAGTRQGWSAAFDRLADAI